MSLFENDLYQWRETYFVLCKQTTRPQAEVAAKTFREQDSHYEVTNIVANDAGELESLTIMAHEDSAAMDITFLTGEEVIEQRDGLLNTIARATLADGDRERLNFLGDCDSRYDIYHFEEATFIAGEEDDPLDPGALLLVMECLAKLCQGVGIDPQSGSFM